MPDDVDSSNIAAGAPNFKLPPFCTIDAPTWFKRAEVQFRLKSETSSTRRADHVLAALPDDIFPLLAEWLDEKGDTPIKYNDLKAQLLTQFIPSPEERIERLFNLSHQPLGDQRPSAAFSEMKAIARLPPAADGSVRKLDLLRALWLMRLPEGVRAGITDFNDMTDATLTKQADDLHNSTKAASRRPVFAATSDDSCLSPTDEGVLAAATSKKFPQPVRYRQQQAVRPQPPPSNQPIQHLRGPPPKKAGFASQLCSYHAKFGPAARNCNQPCSWSKNL